MTLAGALVGALLGLLAVPAVRRLPLGIPERLAQPSWARWACAPGVLVTAGAAAGALLGAAAPAADALVLSLALLGVLLPAVAIDIAWRVVPDTLVVLGAVCALALGDRQELAPHLLAAAIGGGVALAVAVAARGGVGLGDVKLIAMAGLALGAALPVALVVGLGLAGAVALPLLVLRGRGATLPLVPFLAAGILLVAAYGDMGRIPL